MQYMYNASLLKQCNVLVATGLMQAVKKRFEAKNRYLPFPATLSSLQLKATMEVVVVKTRYA